MNWEELENILRSRQTESEEEVLNRLLQAIGHQLGYDTLKAAINQLWLGFYDAEIHDL